MYWNQHRIALGMQHTPTRVVEEVGIIDSNEPAKHVYEWDECMDGDCDDEYKPYTLRVTIETFPKEIDRAGQN